MFDGVGTVAPELAASLEPALLDESGAFAFAFAAEESFTEEALAAPAIAAASAATFAAAFAAAFSAAFSAFFSAVLDLKSGCFPSLPELSLDFLNSGR